MADQLTVNDVGALARAKINAAIVALNALAAQFTALNTAVTQRALQADLNELEDVVDTKAAQTALDSLSATVAGLQSGKASTAALNALDAELNAAQNAIADLLSALGGQNTALVALQSTVGQQGTTQAQHSSRIGTAESKIASQIEAVSAQGNAISATQGAVGTEVTNRIAGDAALGLRVDLAQALVGTVVQHRPGDTPSAFTQSQSGGAPETLPPLPASLIGTNENGRVAILTGQGLVARRRLDPVEPGRLYTVGYAFQRRTDTADPSNNTVRLGIFWYDQGGLALTGGSISTVVADYNDLRLSDGRIRRTATVARQAGVGAQVVAPIGARYARAFVLTFGFDQQTDVEFIAWADVTDAQLFAPAVDDIDARLATFESAYLLARTITLESVTANPRILTFPTRADAIAANVPAVVRNIRLLGYNAPGDGGGGDYKRAGSQPSAGVYFNTNDGAAWVFAGETISLQQAGGFDDGTACDAAWTRAKATGLVISLPALSSGTYTFTSPILLAGASADPAPGVVFSAPACDFSPTFRTTRPILALLRVAGDTQPYAYELTSDNKPTRRSKILWPTQGDIDRDRFEKIDMTTLSHWGVTNGTDNWFALTPAAQAANEVTWNLQPDNVLRTSLLPVRGGQDLRWARSGGDYQGGFMIRSTGAWYFLRAGLTGVASLMSKLLGQTSTDVTNLGWPGISTDGAYYPGNAYWGVRIFDNKTFGLIINGYLAFGPYPVEGEIIEAGPAWFGNQNRTVSASWMNRIYRSVAAGGIQSSLLYIGDSTFENIHGGMADVIAESLDTVRGIRVVAANNYAVGGHSSADQWARLQTLGVPVGTTHAVVLITRNDISGGASADLFSLGYVTNILDYLIARSIRVVLAVPFGAYKRGPAGGRGVDVINEENSARTQMMIAALGASKNVKVVDLNDFSGPAIGELANHPFAPSMWRDNLHESALAYKVYGQALANALAGVTLLAMTPEVGDSSLPAASLSGVYGPMNGWTPAATLPPTYSVRGTGRNPDAILHGRLTPGSRSTAQQIYRLPPNLRPIRQVSFVAESDIANVRIVISPTGIITVFGMETGGSYVTLTGARYPLA